MTAHVKVSGTWKAITGIHTRVSGTWKEVLEGWVKVSGVWKQFYATFNIGDLSVAWQGTSYLQFNTDGTLTTPAGAAGYWVGSAASTGIGTGKYIRMVRTSGYNSMINDNTWLEVTSNRQFAVSVAGFDETWTGYVEYSLDGGSSVVATSVSMDIYALYIGGV